MSDLYQSLKSEFENEEYRYGYAESFLNTKLASQIKTLREQRGKTQAEIAKLMGIKQPGYRRFEDANHSVWKTDSLWSIARALGVRVNISFETFGTLLDEKKRFDKTSLQRPEFKDDPVFKEQAEKRESEVAAAQTQGGTLQRLATGNAAELSALFTRNQQGEELMRLQKPMTLGEMLSGTLRQMMGGSVTGEDDARTRSVGIHLVPKPKPAQQTEPSVHAPADASLQASKAVA